MSKIRNTILSVVLVLIVAVAIYYAAVPLPVMAAQPKAVSGVTCPVARPSADSLSVDQLWKILNGRYERRMAGLPY